MSEVPDSVSHAESFIGVICHQFGDNARYRHQIGGSECLRLGDKDSTIMVVDQTGKWPNGLADAMKRAHVGPTALARLVDTTKQNIDRYAKQQRRLDPSMAVRLAPHLNTTAEALLLLPDAVKKERKVGDALGEVMQLASRLTAEEQGYLVGALLEQRGIVTRRSTRAGPKEKTTAKSR